jgi:hypothetical protein
MRRRDFIKVTVGAVIASPVAARAADLDGVIQQ